MSTRSNKHAAKIIEANVRHVLKHGPGLSYKIKSCMLAKCPTGKHVLLGGLGGMGVGQMWTCAEERHRSDDLWTDLPVEPCVGGFGIREACENVEVTR